MRPRVRRVLETALDCGDLARTAAFYKALLDVTPMLDTDRLVAIDAGEGTVLLLFQAGATGPLATRLTIGVPRGTSNRASENTAESALRGSRTARYSTRSASALASAMP